MNSFQNTFVLFVLKPVKSKMYCIAMKFLFSTELQTNVQSLTFDEEEVSAAFNKILLRVRQETKFPMYILFLIGINEKNIVFNFCLISVAKCDTLVWYICTLKSKVAILYK